jgi:hypothetical protein
LNFICKYGNAKMLRFIVKHYKININQEHESIVQFFINLVLFYLISHKLDCVDYLMNESDLFYSYSIVNNYEKRGERELNKITSDNIIYVNKLEMIEMKPLHLNDINTQDNIDFIQNLLFMRYKKILFVGKYSQKPLNFDYKYLLNY